MCASACGEQDLARRAADAPDPDRESHVDGSGGDDYLPTDDSPTDDAPSATPNLAGRVALAAPIEGADVVARCVSGVTFSARTSIDGRFALEVPAASLPCVLEARGGLVIGAMNELALHGFVTDLGQVNITPLTELVMARALGVSPRLTAQVDETLLAAASAYLDEQLVAVGLAAPAVELFQGPFEDGDATTATIEALWTRLAMSERSLTTLVTVSADGMPWAESLAPVAATWVWVVPDTLVEPVVPASNRMSDAKVALGRFLFHDVRLSGNATTSCATCHHQDKAFTDGRAQAMGSTGELHPRSALGLGNIAFNPTLTWARPAAESLEAQMETPMFGLHPVEMGVNRGNRAEILQRFAADPAYPARFAAAFPGQDNIVSFPNVMKAIASFQRTMLTGDSPYDRALKRRGPALGASAARGATLFFTSANCFRCHGNFNFTDTVVYAGGPEPELRFHNTGLFNIGGTGAFPAPNRGIFESTRVATDMGKFRAPSLRNIAVTAPYMHDGSIATLEEVLDFYAAGGRNITSGPNAGDGRANPFKSDIVNGTNLNLSAQDKADIVAFLRTLTDDVFLTNPAFSDPFAD